ncbi:hypothetical protein Trydic_g5014 [Trypoxylus dichotomus]
MGESLGQWDVEKDVGQCMRRPQKQHDNRENNSRLIFWVTAGNESKNKAKREEQVLEAEEFDVPKDHC